MASLWRPPCSPSQCHPVDEGQLSAMGQLSPSGPLASDLCYICRVWTHMNVSLKSAWVYFKLCHAMLCLIDVQLCFYCSDFCKVIHSPTDKQWEMDYQINVVQTQYEFAQCCTRRHLMSHSTLLVWFLSEFL